MFHEELSPSAQRNRRGGARSWLIHQSRITTFGGAGVLTGGLMPESVAVLDALDAPRGAQDTRSHEQQYHDALQAPDATHRP